MKAVILEVQAGRVKAGQPAEVRLDSNPDRVYKGDRSSSLGRVFRVKSDSQPAIVFDAVIDLSESDPQLMRPGMAAGVNITISSKSERPAGAGGRDRLPREGRRPCGKRAAFPEDLTPVTLGARSGGHGGDPERARRRGIEVVIRSGGPGGGTMRTRDLGGRAAPGRGLLAAACGGPGGEAMAGMNVRRGTFEIVIPAFGELQAAKSTPIVVSPESRFGLQTIAWMAPEYLGGQERRRRHPAGQHASCRSCCGPKKPRWPSSTSRSPKRRSSSRRKRTT